MLSTESGDLHSRWLEMKSETLYFALNMDVMKVEDLQLRKQIGLSILQSETKLPLQTEVTSTCPR